MASILDNVLRVSPEEQRQLNEIMEKRAEELRQPAQPEVGWHRIDFWMCECPFCREQVRNFFEAPTNWGSTDKPIKLP